MPPSQHPQPLPSVHVSWGFGASVALGRGPPTVSHPRIAASEKETLSWPVGSAAGPPRNRPRVESWCVASSEVTGQIKAPLQRKRHLWERGGLSPPPTPASSSVPRHGSAATTCPLCKTQSLLLSQPHPLPQLVHSFSIHPLSTYYVPE